AGRRIEVPNNRADEPLPIHGDGWLSAWQVAEADRENVRLTLDRQDGKPYAFHGDLLPAL
ncbi:hypothetical protein N0P04_34345, partial [Pseudomonas veronii]|nr:hypothetical protein [Pseudomonas veronii]